MSTSKTYQQSLADAGSETRPPMLERGPYQFQMFVPSDSTIPKLQTAEDLQGDALLHYDAEIEVMNLILLSIPNNIYNSVDACTSNEKYTPMETERLDADLQDTPTDQTTYRRMIGGLMYLTASRPDIAYATFDFKFELIAYSDANHAGCKDDCKSTPGGLQFLSEKLVSWSSKKQDCTAMSTAEAEYVSLSACCAQSAIAISCNPVQHSKTKHIDTRYHFIKEHNEKGTVELYFVGTEYQLADLFTKALPK
ncbi:hypothetical protein Tco_0389750 [Tanacetum coccineum]